MGTLVRAMKVLLLAALCATALAVPNGRRLRPEEHWRPAGPRDLSKYRPRSEMYSQDSVYEVKPRPSRPKILPTPSVYDLAAECGIEGALAMVILVVLLLPSLTQEALDKSGT